MCVVVVIVNNFVFIYTENVFRRDVIIIVTAHIQTYGKCMVLRRKTISFSVVCNRNCTSRVCYTRRVVVYSSHIHTRHARQHNFWVFYLSTFGTTTTTMTGNGTALLRTVGDKYDFVHATCKTHSFACNVHICICDLLQLKLIFSNKYHTENVCMLKKKKPNLSSFIVVAVVL